MKATTINILPREYYGHIYVTPLMYPNKDYVLNSSIIEKLEQEQIDDKYILRWTAKLNQSVAKEGVWMDAEDVFRRYQSGYIYTPNAFGKTGLVVLFTDHGAIFNNSDNLPSTLHTTAYMWYNGFSPFSKPGNILAFAANPVSRVLLDLQKIIVPHIVWTDKYELPPLSASVVNKAVETIRDSIARQLEEQIIE